jgi:hypothetical protein
MRCVAVGLKREIGSPSLLKDCDELLTTLSIRILRIALLVLLEHPIEQDTRNEARHAEIRNRCSQLKDS